MDSTSIHDRGLPSIWYFLSDEGRREFENAVELFNNPAPDNPVDAGEFLGHLDLGGIRDWLWSRYSKPQQVFWDPEGMLRCILYFGLKGYQHLTEAWRDLKVRPGLVEALGLDSVPPYKTYWHFGSVRLGGEGLEMVFSLLVELVVSEGQARGLSIGECVTVDATPLETGRLDRRAEYSEHYKTKGYKGHNVVDTEHGIPLDFRVTRINDHENAEIRDALQRVVALGCPVRLVLADAGYDGWENYAFVNHVIGAGLVTGFRYDSVLSDKGEARHICRLYNRLWKRDGYVMGASLEEQLCILYGWGREEEVGKYHRNEMLRVLWSDPWSYHREYDRRVLIEGDHGYWKQHVGMSKFEGRPMEFIERRSRIRLIGMLAAALTRLQNGVTRGLCLTVGIQ
jgi:hypothetical protein